MNKLSKPTSSPDKFPPPLMRFLRSNVGSKSSRRRSRASPMFFRKKNTLIETTQEPSSPKVTCIGQVRVRRCKKNNKTNATTTSHHHRRRNRLCGCIRRIRPKLFITVWAQCVSFFKSCCFCCCCRCNSKSNNSGDLHASLSAPVTKGADSEAGKEKQQNNEQKEENKIVEKTDNIITPKNALLLTRCRSTPYRSSSLASIFRETGDEEKEEEVEELKNEKEDESNECEESKAVPLILSRCKSAPARRWDQLLLPPN